MNLNNIDLIKHNGSEIELIKWNGFILYQKNQEEPDAPEIPLYQEGQFQSDITLTEVRTMVNESHTDLSHMFEGSYNLVSVNTQDWDVSNVTDMSYMFYNCAYRLTKLDLSNWDVNQVFNMWAMFASCRALTELNLSNWVLSAGADVGYMFSNCTSLHTIILDSCPNSTIYKLLGSDTGLPTDDIGITRTIYVNKSAVTGNGFVIKEPDNWNFEYV